MTALDQPSPSASQTDGVLRELSQSDLMPLLALVETDPDAYCVYFERVIYGRLEPTMTGGRTLGWFENDELVSALFVGANLTPINANSAAVAAFVGHLSRRSRVSSAIVGYSDAVLAMWDGLTEVWGPCREVRSDQHLMLMTEDPAIEGNPDLRVAKLEDLNAILGPAIDMFTEEVGISPVEEGRGQAFRARVASALIEGRTYILTEGDRIIFKTEVGAVAHESCQLQGVWVSPELRGTGLAVPALAAVVAAVRRDHAPRVSLYVNSHNVAAIHTYRHAGFRQVGTFATVLF